MAMSTRPAPSGVRLHRIKGTEVTIEGKDDEILVGHHANNAHGDFCFVMWQKFLHVKDSFAMDIPVFRQIDEDVEYIYVVDTRNKDIYKFEYEAYSEAEVFVSDGNSQLVPPRWDCEDMWERCADNVVRGIYD